MPNADGTPLEPRSRLPWSRILVAAALLAAIFVAARACQDRGIEITKDEAIVIAREEVSFTPDLEIVRLHRQGIQFKAYWAVSLSQRAEGSGYKNVTVVFVDAESGEVTSVRRQ